MRFSESHSLQRITAIVLFIAAMGGVWFVAKTLAYEWIPESLIGYVAVGMVGLGIGLWIGGNSANRRSEKTWD